MLSRASFAAYRIVSYVIFSSFQAYRLLMANIDLVEDERK